MKKLLLRGMKVYHPTWGDIQVQTLPEALIKLVDTYNSPRYKNVGNVKITKVVPSQTFKMIIWDIGDILFKHLQSF